MVLLNVFVGCLEGSRECLVNMKYGRSYLFFLSSSLDADMVISPFGPVLREF